MKLDRTKSLENVLTAFAGEAQAVSRYSIYADIAREEGHFQVAALFEKMMKNEREHAKIWYKLLNGGTDDTLKNLESAAKSENREWKSMYPSFAEDARAEGLEELAVLFERVASIESGHERSFLETAFSISDGKIESIPTKSNKDELYYCIFCGHSEHQKLGVCPVCGCENAFSK